ncbi:hypothetical protein LTR97_000169 [Elasticomyces elasticus]|uniref:Uncharacterized protein n=1 Tax=Elasticomyces elasticus TaxID=574655 RepID=A0AAN7WIL3_9PEZI|nr:hypothetical protein LTR97_000169 [Elasticomyces elasticus]
MLALVKVKETVGGRTRRSICPVSEAVVKRDTNFTALFDYPTIPSAIEVRTLKEPKSPKDLKTYLQGRQQLKGLVNLITPGVSYCKQLKFADLPRYKSTVVGMGNADLVGCTVTVLVSARAVYMCHFVERLHFPHVHTAPVPNEVKYTFIDAMNFVTGNQPQRGCGGDSLDKTLFQGGDGDNTQLYIMTPRSRATPDDVTSQEHNGEITLLTAVMRIHVPGAQVTTYNYYARTEGYPGLDNYVKGAATWEYDPNADGNGNADWRLWFEETNRRGSSVNQKVV